MLNGSSLTGEAYRNHVLNLERGTTNPDTYGRLLNEFPELQNDIPMVQRMTPADAAEFLKKPYQTARILTDPVTGETLTNADGTVFVEWEPYEKVTVEGGGVLAGDPSAMPAEVTAGLASGTYLRGRDGRIYNAGNGQLVWEPPRESESPSGEATTPTNPANLPPTVSTGPVKIRR
jgi:hypothetical protein